MKFLEDETGKLSNRIDIVKAVDFPPILNLRLWLSVYYMIHLLYFEII